MTKVTRKAAEFFFATEKGNREALNAEDALLASLLSGSASCVTEVGAALRRRHTHAGVLRTFGVELAERQLEEPH